MAANPKLIDTPINRLLDRLSGVKQTRPDRWQARCPAHDDRSPSLAVTEKTDGTILLKCWAGCSADAIVGAVGMGFKDLFPPDDDWQAYRASNPPRYSASEVVKTITTEATILMLGYRALQRGDRLNAADAARVEVAIAAIDTCREVTR